VLVTQTPLPVAAYRRVVVRLNIGGTLFTTFLSTLEKAPASSVLFQLTEHIKVRGVLTTRRISFTPPSAGPPAPSSVVQSSVVVVPHCPPFVSLGGGWAEGEDCFSLAPGEAHNDAGALQTSLLFLDRDPIAFRTVLNHLRSAPAQLAPAAAPPPSGANPLLGSVGVVAFTPDQLQKECDYYGIPRIV
jgi:hypothetical protein